MMNKKFQDNTTRRFFVGDNLGINRLRNTVGNILSSTGVTVNGNNPWDIQIKNENFYRIWKYYPLSCAGAFRARNIQLWQIAFSKMGVPGGYNSIR